MIQIIIQIQILIQRMIQIQIIIKIMIKNKNANTNKSFPLKLFETGCHQDLFVIQPGLVNTSAILHLSSLPTVFLFQRKTCIKRQTDFYTLSHFDLFFLWKSYLFLKKWLDPPPSQPNKLMVVSVKRLGHHRLRLIPALGHISFKLT